MKLLSNLKNISFVEKLKYFAIAPLVIVVFGAIMLCINGINLGIDFTGGTAVSVQFGEQINNQSAYDTKVNEIKDVMQEFGLKLSLDQRMGEGAKTKIQVRYQDISGKTTDEMGEITQNFVDALQVKYPTYVVTNDNRISASASSALVLNALLAVCISIVLIVIYLAIRFKNILFGLGTIICLVHDLAIMVSFMLIFGLEISSTFIAALITIIGYGINNNVVIFDRIRENKKIMQGASVEDITNKSINQSMTRTLITTFTTLIVIIGLLFIGIVGITSFVLPIVIGLIASLYSSIFLVSSLWAVMEQKRISKN